MRIAIVALLALLVLAQATDKSDHWAVLVAGSKGFYNYRHQTDICHAYQIMKKNGIPEENIIVFSYDDVANSPSNPFPGKLFNKPDGEDVYAGCNIDYRGADVTPQKFLDVLVGKGDGKVLKSNSKSKVFINFADHGAPGLIAFPSKYLYAKDFHTTMMDMKAKEMYNEMTVYIEACESGSMFENILESDVNIYATTAANAHESSWGWYCHPQDMVQGKHIGSCLGDEYSITWMEDSDAHDVCQETVGEQFDTVQKNVVKSHVMEYGQTDFKGEAVGNFQGVCDAKSPVEMMLKSSTKRAVEARGDSGVMSRDIKMHHLFYKYMESNDEEDRIAMEAELENRNTIETRYFNLRSNSGINFEEKPVVKDFECYRGLIELYEQSCGVDEYDLGFFHNFVSMCNAKMETNSMISLVRNMC